MRHIMQALTSVVVHPEIDPSTIKGAAGGSNGGGGSRAAAAGCGRKRKSGGSDADAIDLGSEDDVEGGCAVCCFSY
jgi:hypothetical protein